MEGVQSRVNYKEVSEIVIKYDEFRELVDEVDRMLTPLEKGYINPRSMIDVYAHDWLNQNKLNGDPSSFIAYVTDQMHDMVSTVASQRLYR